MENPGEFQIGDNITPLDPNSVESVVYYGVLRSGRSHQATGYSLIYNQLYPFEGLKNYTSGIIHHVRLKGLKPNTLYYYQCGDPSIALPYIHEEDKMDKNFSHYGDPDYPFGAREVEVADDTPLEQAAKINMLRKSIANKMARDYNLPEIP